jgi:hypothetical protein
VGDPRHVVPKSVSVGTEAFAPLIFSKKLDNHMAAIALHSMHYNFARPHKALALAQEDGPAIKQSPAMAAGIADHLWTVCEIVELSN